MAKKKNLEDIYYPVPQSLNQIGSKPPLKNEIVRRIIQGSIKGAYKLKNPSQYDYKGYPVKPKAVATQEQIDMVIHLIESLQPADAIEAVLASQFAITYIRGLEDSAKEHSSNSMMELFEFGHKVLETLTKYRTKGAQDDCLTTITTKAKSITSK